MLLSVLTNRILSDVWLAADIDVTTIMTLDLRDFSRYWLPDGRGFMIL
ncbi:MAG: hypothetical protein AB8C46_14250 [Burkholderiaceae bacterium]